MQGGAPTAPAERCDIDHVIPVLEGPTGGDNLRHLCRRHHRAKTFGAFGVTNDDSDYRWRTERKRTTSHCEAAFGKLLAEYAPP